MWLFFRGKKESVTKQVLVYKLIEVRLYWLNMVFQGIVRQWFLAVSRILAGRKLETAKSDLRNLGMLEFSDQNRPCVKEALYTSWQTLAGIHTAWEITVNKTTALFRGIVAFSNA